MTIDDVVFAIGQTNQALGEVNQSLSGLVEQLGTHFETELAQIMELLNYQASLNSWFIIGIGALIGCFLVMVLVVMYK